MDLFDEFRRELRDLYFFNYFASAGLQQQSGELVLGHGALSHAMRQEFGEQLGAQYTIRALLTVPELEFPHAPQVREQLRVGFSEIISWSQEGGNFGARMSEYTIILLVVLWESKFRPKLKEAGYDDRSDFWGSVVRIRNCLLHNQGFLDRHLPDQETFGFLSKDAEIELDRTRVNAIVAKAFEELSRLEESGPTRNPDKETERS